MTEPVHVWRVDLAEARGASSLSADERRRASAFVRADDRERFERAHAAVRAILSSYLDVEAEAVPLLRLPGGKPCLADGRLQFNLSHGGGDLALLAVSRDREVGVDLEMLGPMEDETARAFLTDDELEPLASLADELRVGALYRAWVRKEAFLKAIGRGLAGLRDVDVSLGGIAAIRATRPDPALRERWDIVDLEVGKGWAAALAARRTGSPLEIEWFDFGRLSDARSGDPHDGARTLR